MKYGSVISVMLLNDITKTKCFKFVGMLPAVHRFALIDSNMADQRTGDIIQKPGAIIDHNEKMDSIDLVGCVCNTIRSTIKVAESFIYIAIYNKFIIRKKLNPNDPKDNLKFRTLLIEEILLF